MLRILLLPLLLVPIASAASVDQNNVEFASPGGKPLSLDLHVPEGKGPFPTVIIVHGGGFDMGDKRMFVTPLFDVLTNAGFAWFTVNYRLAPDAQILDQTADVDAAIRWVRTNAAKYKVDVNRIALAGESAGGYLVAYAGTHQTPETKVAAVVDFYGPNDLVRSGLIVRAHPDRFDMAKKEGHDKRRGGPKFWGIENPGDTATKYRELSPVTSVKAGMPPFLCIHGDADEQVPYELSPEMCDAMHKAGVKCDVITVKGGKHGMGSWKAPEMQHWKAEMVAWLKETLR